MRSRFASIPGRSPLRNRRPAQFGLGASQPSIRAPTICVTALRFLLRFRGSSRRGRFSAVRRRTYRLPCSGRREKDSQPYFRVRLNASNKLGENRPIIPGMMANVDILTKRHTVLQYLMMPLMTVQDMAFRR